MLAIYLLATPSSDELVERAQALDDRLRDQPRAILTPALAAVLEIPESSVDCFLRLPQATPSALVFNKLLNRCETHCHDGDPATAVLESGLSMNEALRYFDTVEKQVIASVRTLARGQQTDRVEATNPVMISARESARKNAFGLR